jgi:hypothetical protein
MVLDDPELESNFYTNKIFFDNYCCDIIFQDNLYNVFRDKVLNDYSILLKVKNRLIEKYNTFE